MIWKLLIAYQIKHFLCDYPLQGAWMLGKFKKYPDYILPLLVHSGVHALVTFAIALIVKPEIAFLVALFDLVIHFIMDRIKASPNLLGRFKSLSANEMKDILSYIPTLGKTAVKVKYGDKLLGNKYFWWSLGLDQAVHHLTHYIIIYFLLR